MANVVLVHGAWHGGWCWRRVLPGLRAAGHAVHALTLTGLGERAHLLSPRIDLATHVQDVVALIEAEELDDVVLVGHSYAGMVITGATDRLPDRIGRLVYLDAVLPEPGESWSSTHDAATQARRREDILRSGSIAAPDPAVFGLSGDDHAWVARRQTPQPGGVYDDALHFDAQRVFDRPRSFIDCVAPALPTIAVARRRVQQAPGWQVVTLQTGHDPMVSAPDDLVRALFA